MKFIEDKDAIREVVFTRIHNMYDEAKKQEPKQRNIEDKSSTHIAQGEKKREADTKEFQDKVSKDATSASEETNEPKEAKGKTAVEVVSENSNKISEILWRVLSREKRKILDNIFEEQLKTANLFVANLDTKDEEFRRLFVQSKLAQRASAKEDNKQANAPVSAPAPEVKKPQVFSNLTDTQGKPLVANNQPEHFEEIVMEALLGDLAKSALGLKPSKVKEIQLNAKYVYNNCVLITAAELYLTNLMKAFAKSQGLDVDKNRYADQDFEEHITKKEAIKSIADSLNIDRSTLLDYVNKLELYTTLKSKGEDDFKGDDQNKFYAAERFIKNFEEKHNDKIKAIRDQLKDLKIFMTESIEPKQQELILEFKTAIVNWLRQKFKVTNLADVNQQRFNAYCNYLFTNKQFFIDQTQLLKRYAGNYNSIGISFYQALADFNALDKKTRSKLTEASFDEASNFQNLFPIIQKISKVIAVNVVREAQKEIDRIMPASYKAGVKVGEFLGRTLSGQSKTKPIETGTGTEG
jgi:hypothetical protein